MNLSRFTFFFGLTVSTLGFAHGGNDGHNHPVGDTSQMPASLTSDYGPPGAGGSTSIQGNINLSQPSIKSVGGGGGPVGNGGAGEAALDAPQPVYPHMSAAKTVPNGTSRSVPGYDGGNANGEKLVLDRYSLVAPRTNDSIQIYNRAYNADRELMNKWLKTLGN